MTAAAPSAPPPTTSETNNRWLYWTIGIVLVVLAVVGLVVYKGAKTDADAAAKAQTLSQKFEAAGLPAPNQEVIIRSFGTDGGAVCDNPANALGKATMFGLLTNGASFVGQRPIIVDGRMLQGEALILETYCPEKLSQYQEAIKKLKYADLIRLG